MDTVQKHIYSNCFTGLAPFYTLPKLQVPQMYNMSEIQMRKQITYTYPLIKNVLYASRLELVTFYLFVLNYLCKRCTHIHAYLHITNQGLLLHPAACNNPIHKCFLFHFLHIRYSGYYIMIYCRFETHQTQPFGVMHINFNQPKFNNRN
jgi:hypothetical protein